MPAAESWLRRLRFLDLDMRLFGTAMDSSSSLRWDRAAARPEIQVGPAPRAESGAVLPAQRKSGHGECELLADRRGHVHLVHRLHQGVNARVVLEIRIGREHHVELIRDRPHELLQAAPAGTAHQTLQPSVPEVVAPASGLQHPRNAERAVEVDVESLEERISGSYRPQGLDRAVPEVPYIDPEHSS